jgi:cytochrome c biogenesis protein CcdA/thiol-disulfide isomerase/thioredoxin
MLLLTVFAFVAGAGTALSPCVLPVLPVALAAGATGGRRRPLGVVAGLVLSFTFATVALVYVISALGLPDDLLRNVAIGVLVVFGAILIVPALAARVEAAVARLTSRVPTAARGDGFGSGVLLGMSLGLLYAPCAGPILAGVITVSASQTFTAGRLAVAFAYSLGSAVVLYALMLGGRRVTRTLSRRSGALQPVMGVVMVVVAVAMAAELDIRFQNEIADELPAVLVNPTKALEDSDEARASLADVRSGGNDGAVAQADAPETSAGTLPVLARAPEIQGTQRWFNTPGGRSLTLEELRGHVVLIDFWTYSCINCIRTLPHLKAWDARYHDAGLTIIGIHAPEFPFERDADNVASAIKRNGLEYPVAQDNDFATWNAYGNQFWPAKYLIDARGRIRYAHFGEGAYDQTEGAVRTLLREAGKQDLGGMTGVRGESGLPTATPETYVGSARAERFVNGPLLDGTRTFDFGDGEAAALPVSHAALDGRWRIGPERSVAAGADSRLHLKFVARKVFLVLGSARGPRTVGVQVDGRPRPGVRVAEHELYELVRLPRPGEHLLTLELPKGVEAYAFTFG